MDKNKVKIKLIKSPLHHRPRIRATVRALGLRKIRQVKEHSLTPQIKGMINKVNFLVKVVEEK